MLTGGGWGNAVAERCGGAMHLRDFPDLFREQRVME